MSRPRKMSKEERQFSNALIENIKQLMLKHDIKSDAECMRNIKKVTGFLFNQSKFSDIKNGKLLPTMSELIAFSDFFGVSIDYLLGREQAFEAYSVYEICENLARLFVSDVNIDFTAVEEAGIFFNAIYFRCTSLYTENALFPPSSHDINSKIIEDFIKEMQPVVKLVKEGSITKDVYNIIVSGFLKKIEPQKQAYKRHFNPLPPLPWENDNRNTSSFTSTQ